jgi:hypothetical protein
MAFDMILKMAMQIATNGGAGHYIAFLVAFSGKYLYNLAEFHKFH